MQKIVCLSNSRDYTEQGWKVAILAPNMVALNDCKDFEHKESIAAFALLEKGDEDN